MNEFIREEPTVAEEPVAAEKTWEPVLPEETPVRDDLPIKKKRQFWWLIPVILAVLAAAAAVVYLSGTRDRQYEEAKAFLKEENYLEAERLFLELEDYRDAPEQALQCRYEYAVDLIDQKRYEDAATVFEELGDFENSAARAGECSCLLAEQALKEGDFEAAKAWFSKIPVDLKASRRWEIAYNLGHTLYLKAKYEEAQPYLEEAAQDPQYDIPHFLDPRDAIAYLKALEPPFDAVTVVVRNMSPFYENMNWWNASVQQSIGYQFAEVTYDEENRAVTLIPDYYPGQKILWAYESGDFSNLTKAEEETYAKALKLVEQAKAETTDEIGLELWLHDWVCTNVEYDSPYSYVYPEDYVGLDELTCVGAILDGKANCQGYTDAFYLLGSLAGLEVHKVFGDAGGGHCWNAVRLDGWLYTVDTTFNDTFCREPENCTYVWFNNVLDMNQYTVWGGVSQFEKMAFLEDITKTYYCYKNLVFADLQSACEQLLRNYETEGAGMYYALVDQKDLTDTDFHKAMQDAMAAAGIRYLSFGVSLTEYKEDTYVTVYFG